MLRLAHVFGRSGDAKKIDNRLGILAVHFDAINFSVFEFKTAIKRTGEGFLNDFQGLDFKTPKAEILQAINPRFKQPTHADVGADIDIPDFAQRHEGRVKESDKEPK